MFISLQPAFILHSRAFRETSLIVELFTLDYGRIAAVARQVRVKRSRTRSILQSFVPLCVSCQGKSELMTLTAVEAQGTALKLYGERLLSAFYLNELLMRVLPKQDAYPALYANYHQTLIELQHNSYQLKTLRLFEKKLLQELGYGLALSFDFLPEENYSYYPEQGFTLFSGQEKMTNSRLFSGKNLLSFAKEELNDLESLQAAKRLMRLALAPLLGSQPLHSRKLFTKVEK